MTGADDEAGDATVPTGRAGVDPLIVFPLEASGHTGQIERPGDETPWWFIPGLCAVALGFIGLLLFIEQDRQEQAVASVEQTATNGGSVPVVPLATAAPTTLAATTTTAPTTTLPPPSTIDPAVADLPGSGFVRVDTDEFEIVSRCEVQLPFDPVDTEFQMSSYFFFDNDGRRQLIDRVFDGATDTAQLFGNDGQFVELIGIGDTGAFTATFNGPGGEFDVVVNAAGNTEPACGDQVVTNEPGQFTEPHTRIVLDVCVDRTTDAFATIVGLTSHGARFEILQAGGELAEIVFVERDGTELRTTAPAFIIRSGDITSASGIVSDGVNDLDITIDLGATVTEADARTCTASDRL
ncbi:MAG: hypothetical protein ACJAR2_001423 [Ilumatobacter sp.]|jgi:hypothetical protein